MEDEPDPIDVDPELIEDDAGEKVDFGTELEDDPEDRLIDDYELDESCDMNR